ncbi:unnamed protein product, partial [marine sediment metagenome]
KEIPSSIERETLKAKGIKLLSYIGGNAWFASISDEDALRFNVPKVVAKYPFLKQIRSISEIFPEDKVAPQIREKRIGDWARTADGKVELVVNYFKDASIEQVKKKLEQLGATIIGEIPAVHSIVISIQEEKIRSIANEDSISWIELVPPSGKPESDRARTHVQVDAAHASGLNGNGVDIGVFEKGHCSNTHPDLAGRVTKGDADPWDRRQHPTMTGGMIAGNGSQSTAHGGAANQWRGN